MKSQVRVFYAGLLYGEYTMATFKHLQMTCEQDIYNKAYVHMLPIEGWVKCPWYMMDLTPVLQAQVPKELLTSVLLLT